MNTAEELFQILQSLKQDNGSSKLPEERLFDYCTQVLGSIERYSFDFKEKSDCRNPKLSDIDRKNLAKAVSGFANSSGGVLIWGIENSSIAPKPITDIQKFISALLKLAPQTTNPIVPGIDGDWIPSGTGNTNEGFGIIYIPESHLPPHRVILNQEGIKDHYYVRSGETFVVASHSHLEDMFGRRPRPKLEFVARLENIGRRGCGIVIGLRNTGRYIAKFPYLAVKINQPFVISEYHLDGNGKPGLPLLLQYSQTDQSQSFGGSASIVVYPDSELDVTEIRFENRYSTKSEDAIPDLVVYYSICCEGIQMQKGETRILGSQIKNLWLHKA